MRGSSTFTIDVEAKVSSRQFAKATKELDDFVQAVVDNDTDQIAIQRSDRIRVGSKSMVRPRSKSFSNSVLKRRLLENDEFVKIGLDKLGEVYGEASDEEKQRLRQAATFLVERSNPVKEFEFYDFYKTHQERVHRQFQEALYVNQCQVPPVVFNNSYHDTSMELERQVLLKTEDKMMDKLLKKETHLGNYADEYVKTAEELELDFTGFIRNYKEKAEFIREAAPKLENNTLEKEEFAKLSEMIMTKYKRDPNSVQRAATKSYEYNLYKNAPLAFTLTKEELERDATCVEFEDGRHATLDQGLSEVFQVSEDAVEKALHKYLD